MPRLLPAAERLVRARQLIETARSLPVPPGGGKNDFSYIAQVKDLLRQAREMVQFIPKSPSATTEMKEEVKKIYQEADEADREILRPRS